MGHSGCDEILMKEPEGWWIGHKLFKIFYFEEGSRECSHRNGDRGFEEKKPKRHGLFHKATRGVMLIFFCWVCCVSQWHSRVLSWFSSLRFLLMHPLICIKIYKLLDFMSHKCEFIYTNMKYYSYMYVHVCHSSRYSVKESWLVFSVD